MQYNYGLDIKELEKRTHKDYFVTKKMLDVNAPEYENLAEGDKIALSYLVKAARDIYIGRGQSNQIHFQNIVVSSTHARLVKEGTSWIIYDEKSTNGIYVNNNRISGSMTLHAGDIIYIMGLKIIIGNGFSARECFDRKHIAFIEHGIGVLFAIE